MGLIGAAFGFGFIAGPALAGVLVRLSPAAPGVAAAGFSLTALLMTLFLLPESLPPERRGAPASGGWWATRLAAWQTPGLPPLLLISLAVVTGFAAFEVTFAQLVYRRFGLHEGSIAFLFAFVGVLAALMQGLLVGRLARWLGERRMLLAGLLATAAGLLALAAQHRLPPFIALLPLLTFGQALTMPALSTLVSAAAPDHRQGESLGAYQSAASLARVIGPLAGQLALGHVGLAAPAVLASLCAAGAAVGVLLLPRPSPTPASG